MTASDQLKSRGDIASTMGPGQVPQALQSDASGALIVTGSITIGDVSFSGSIGAVTVTNFPPLQAVAGTVDVTVTGSTGLHVALPKASPGWVTGSVGVDGITFPESIGVTVVTGSRSTTPTRTSFTGSLVDVQALAANPSRRGFSVTCGPTNASLLFLSLGTAAATTASNGFDVVMPAKALYESPFGYTGAVHIVWNSNDGSAFCNVLEVT